MPTLFSRRYMRGKPKRNERMVGASILVLLGLIVTAFVLTGGFYDHAVGEAAVVRTAKASLGISDRPLFLADAENMAPPAPPHQMRLADSLLPQLPQPWQRVKMAAEQAPPWTGSERVADRPWTPDVREAARRTLTSMYGATWVYRAEYENTGTRNADAAGARIPSRTHENEDAAPKLEVTIADAGTPDAAFGLWRALQEPGARPLSIGRSGWSNETMGRVAFWAGRYYTEIATGAALDAGELETLARAVASVQIPYGGPFWAESVLPAGQLPNSLAYVPRMPLGLQELSECWLAEYPGGVTLGVARPDSPDALLNVLRQRLQQAPHAAEPQVIPAVADGYSGDEAPPDTAATGEAGAGQLGELAEAIGPPAVAGRIGDRIVVAFPSGPYLFIAAATDDAALSTLAAATIAHVAARPDVAGGGAPTDVRRPAGAGRARFAEVPGGDILAPPNIERYTDNLYEKINGREDAFWAFHFVELRFGQYLDSRTRQVYDVYIYDMGEPLNAMGIHLHERSDAGEPLAVGRDGYMSGTSAYYWKGQYFINILGPVEGGEAAAEVSRRIAAAIAATIADTGSELWAEELLPADNRLPDSLVYRATSGLGFDFLEGLFLASYERDGQRYQMFLVRSSTPAEAAELFEKFVEATDRYDTVVLRQTLDAGEMVVGESLDIYSVAFHRGIYLGGVVECEDMELAVERAAALRERLP